MKTINNIIYQGIVNPELRITFTYIFDIESDKAAIISKDDNRYYVFPNYFLSISEGYEKTTINIGSKRYFALVTLFEKSVKMIQDSLYDLFPNLNSEEFEIDQRALERFKLEKAVSSAKITIVPSTWVNRTQQCFPALSIINDVKNQLVTIPLEDAIGISALFQRFEPNTFSMMLITNMGNF